MSASVIGSAIVLVIGIVVFIILCFKGFNTAIAALIGACIVAFGCTDGWLDAMFSLFPSGVGSFISSQVLLYFSSGVFAFLMRETKSGNAIADNMVKLIGANRAPLVIVIITAIIQIAGVSTYVLVAPIALALMQSSDLPVNIGFAACVGIPPLISFCLPGVTALPNVLPTSYLGTTIYAAPMMGLVCCAVGLCLAALYLTYIIRRSRAKGEHYVEPGETMAGVNVAAEGRYGKIEVPSMWKGLVPLASVLILACVFLNVFGLTSTQSVVIAMWIGSAEVVVMNWDVCIKQIKVKNIISCGPMEIVPFMMMAGCVYGFGNVTAATYCFEPLKEAILSINLNPYFTAFITIALVAALCADGIAGMTLWLGTFAETFLAMPGVSAAAMHRILVMSSTTFDSLPHCGSIANAMALFRTNHKESYGHVFILTVCIPVILALLGVGMAILFY